MRPAVTARALETLSRYMFGTVFLLLVVVWIACGYVSEHIQQTGETRRRSVKAAVRRRMLSVNPDSPTAMEALGDSLRESDQIAEAVECYEKALALASDAPGGSAARHFGPGIHNKLRLARFEMETSADPGRFGHTMRTRQQVCRTCGILGNPQDRDCRECSAPLPVDSILHTWGHAVMRRAIIAESGMALLKIAIIVLAVGIASALPLLLRVSVGSSALIVIPMRLLKKLGDG